MERSPPRRPDREDRHAGLAYALWLPDDPKPWPGVVIVHGAGSRKENHADFARLAVASGWAALAFDLTRHGARPAGGPRSLSPCRATARRSRRCRPQPSRTWSRWRRYSGQRRAWIRA